MMDHSQDQILPPYTILPFWPLIRKLENPLWHRILRTHLPVPCWQQTRTKTLRHYMNVSCDIKYTHTHILTALIYTTTDRQTRQLGPRISVPSLITERRAIHGL